MKVAKKAATLVKPKVAKTLKSNKIKSTDKSDGLANKVKKAKKEEASSEKQPVVEPELAAMIKELQAVKPEKNKAKKVKKVKNPESKTLKVKKATAADEEPEPKASKKAKVDKKEATNKGETQPTKVKKQKRQENPSEPTELEPAKPKKVKALKEDPPKALEKKSKAVKLAISKPKSKVAKKQTDKKTKKKKDGNLDIESLKKIDPEFYDFLKKNDKKLLEFNAFDSDDDDEDDEEDQDARKDKEAASDAEEDEDDEKFHKPKADLEVASDESDFEDGEDEQMAADGTVKITLNLLRQWQVELEKPNPSIDIVRKAIQAFNSALASIAAEADELKSTPTAFKVVGAAAFNGVIQLCVLHLQPALIAILGIQPRSKMPLQKCKKWVKVRGCLRYYLTDLIRLIDQVSSANILSVLLKHLHQMAGMVAPFTALGKTILKRLIVIWGQAEEHIRVLAFICILKITRNQQGTMLHHVLKAMYLSYVRNSKFVSPNTLPAINFMRRSLTEMFALDLNVAYQHAFLYIRQLAIHLRNAVILKKKDSFQAVYNWQYVNSIRLWTSLLSTTANKPQLQPLVYPLVTITMGVVRLIPTAQYFPLRFHCIQSLVTLAKGTHTYIPLMPLILEVLRSTTFNKKHTTVSMRPLQFTCILRLNKGQLAENGMRDEVVEQVVGLSLEYLAFESASLAFPDLVVPAVMALKAYLKQCRNANYSRKLKQLLDKIQENSRFIEQERRKINFGLKDLAQVQAWETLVRNKGTPLDIYYNSWVKTHETKKRRQASQVDTINADYDVPVVKKSKKKTTLSIKNEQGEVELFPSDSEDEGEVDRLPVDDDEGELSEEEVKPKAKKQKKTKKSKQPKEAIEPEVPIEEPGNENVDIVKDLDLDDW